MKISCLMTTTPFAKDVSNIISQAITQTSNTEVSHLTWDGFTGWTFDNNKVGKIDLTIVDFTENEKMYGPNVILEKGLPIIPICAIGFSIPEEYRELPSIIYDRNRLSETLLTPLQHYIANYPLDFFIKKTKSNTKDGTSRKNDSVNKKSTKIFISYCHTDLSYLERVKVHLKPFEKKGLIDIWSDQKIIAGKKWQSEIKKALRDSAIAILLISADFLASDFILENELPPILSAAESEGKLILPVIIKPCRFAANSDISKFQAVNDPKIPLSSMTESNKEEIFVEIANIISNIISEK